MDFDLMITSFPKLLGATVVTLKLLSADNNFKVTTVAPKSFGKLVIIKSKSINTPCYT